MKTLAMLLTVVVLIGCSGKSGSKSSDSKSSGSKSSDSKSSGSKSSGSHTPATSESTTEGKSKSDKISEKPKIPVTRIHSKQEAIAAITKLGGIVKFAEKKPGKPVIGVYLIFTKVTDAGLVHLKGMTNLQTLDLSFTNVTAAGVKKLQAALPKCKIIR